MKTETDIHKYKQQDGKHKTATIVAGIKADIVQLHERV